MSHSKRVKVSLKLNEKSVPVKIGYSRNIVEEMTGNLYFGAGTPITPPLADVTTATNELETAYLAAQDGGKEQTAIMHEKLSTLNVLLTSLGNYVENIANQTPEEAEIIILSAGIEVRTIGGQPTLPIQPENLRANYADKQGGVALNCDPVSNAKSYIWLMCTTPDGSSPFRMKRDHSSVTTKSNYLWDGLDPGQQYAFKVFAVGAGGISPISDVVLHRAS